MRLSYRGFAIAFIRYIDDFLHPTNVSANETYLDPVRVKGGLREDVLDDASRQYCRALILLPTNIHLGPGADVLSVLTIHTSLKDNTSPRAAACAVKTGEPQWAGSLTRLASPR